MAATSAMAKDVTIYDRRSGNNPALSINLADSKSFSEFEDKIRKIFKISPKETFVICTTNREAITNDEIYNELDEGETLYLLVDLEQELPAPTQQRVHYLPHYDTLVKSGMYEYYASEGQNPLSYAFAELIDNSLAATASNSGLRNVEIRLMLEDGDKSTILVIDNGKGMTSRQLNNWAIYRLSKFSRKDNDIRSGDSDDESNSSVAKSCDHVPRSLNSDISYFGVGGKQAIFFIGNSTRMITKTKNSCDVHELSISKEEFERKEKSKEFIYSGYIHNRQSGDPSHVPVDDEHVRKFIAEEQTKKSFTCVIVQGISQEQVHYAKHNFKNITKQLSHIYHYYIHGAHGNQINKEFSRSTSPLCNINIEVKLCVKGVNSKTINLRDIDDDLQSQYIHTAENSFEFKAIVEGTGVVEGILRYHPFLYDRETYPSDGNDLKILDIDDDHDFINDSRPARGRRPIFECFWNGRLIPYTTIDHFDWCNTPKKSKNIPLDCYNRVSGVLWTNDKFQVSTNKLTFMDLEVRLRDKNTIFCRVVNGQEKRGNIDKQFTDWLKECHESCDKQVKFCNFRGIIMRSELPRSKQHPWAVFHSIEWDGKKYKKGQLVRIQRTLPIVYGTIKRFLLFGDYDGDIFATGGDIEIVQEPKSLYDDVKVMPLVKLDRCATDSQIKKSLEEEEGKLPEKLIVTWPEGDELLWNEKRPAGKTIGAIKVEISNRRGELISKLPGSTQKKLLIELKVVWHSPSGDQTIVNHICQHAKNWPYWFRKMENIKNLGSHTLSLQTVVNESDASFYAGKELPSHKIKFTVIEAGPERFTVGLLDGPFRVGIPFQVPLEFQDKFGNSTKPSNKFKPELTASGLLLKYDTLLAKGNSLLIKGIIAKGTVETNAGKNFNLIVTIPGLEEDSQSLKIRLLPGLPSKLIVKPDHDIIDIENGDPVLFNIQIQDISGNCTTEPKLTVVCKFSGGQSNLPTYTADCSTSGQTILTGEPLHLKAAKTMDIITAKIEVQNRHDIIPMEKTIRILPSSRAANLKLTYKNELDERVGIEKEIVCVAGTSLQGLEFCIFDEGGRELEMNSTLANKVKVNWVQNLKKDKLLNGQLPDIKVPLSVKECKYCNVSVSDNVEFSFVIKVKPGEPSSIKCTCSESNRIRLGELLQSDILVAVSDEYGNNIKKLPLSVLGNLEITGENLITDHLVRALGQSGGFVIKGVSFETGTLGPREVCVRWRGLVDYVRVQMVAGIPAEILLPGFDTNEVITVYNNNSLLNPLIVQLCDEAGNACDDSNIRIQLGVDEGIKLIPSPQPMKTDSYGRVNFGKFTIVVRSSHIYPSCPGNLCEQNCKGVFSICPKAFCGRNLITGPVLKIHVPSDPTKAVELKVDHDKTATYTVGETMPEFRVKVIAEDNSILDSVKQNEVSMKIWKAEGVQNKPPLKAITYSPSIRLKCNEVGIFTFKDRPIPEEAGTYNIIFVYASDNTNLHSNLIAINVLPGRPVRLVAAQNILTPTVSNTSKISSRTLFKSMKLELRDAFDNPAGFNYHGKVSIRITSDTTVSEVPQLGGGDTTVEVPLKKGQALIQNLTIEEDTSGIDGQEYILQFTVQIPDLPRNHKIAPLELSFLFYNDVKTQAAMANLSQDRDYLINSIKRHKLFFESSQQLISELKQSVQVACQEENKLKSEMRKHNILSSQLSSLENVEKLIKSFEEEKERIYSAPRRQPGLSPAPRDPEVLGKIAHLSQLDGNDIAQVLSWHMSADMDCIVTHTLSKAKEIYYKTKGSQQVLALDSLYKKNLPDWKKPLPHLKIKTNFQPTGNPKYARDLFVFPNDPENCKLVFGMLLGDTIILDTLDDATKYRQEVVKHTYCPTLLTRQGDRIRSNGKFGGQQNRAPPIEKLRGAVFGESLPSAYYKLSTVLELLQSFKAAMHRHEQAEKDLNAELEQQKSAVVKEKLREHQEEESRLREIEEQLGIKSNKVQKTGRNRSPITRGHSSKRNLSDVCFSLGEDMDIVALSDGARNSSEGISTRNFALTRARRGAESPGRSDDRKRRKT